MIVYQQYSLEMHLSRVSIPSKLDGYMYVCIFVQHELHKNANVQTIILFFIALTLTMP
jgi:hypothetical protein